MRHQSLLLVIAILLGPGFTGTLRADYPIEVIELQSRSAAEVIPVLKPLLGAGESISGMGNNLILKVPPGRLQQVREALRALDRPARRLLITVDNRGGQTHSSSGYNASADIRAGDGQFSINSPGRPVDASRARIRLQDRSAHSSGTSSYQVQALEGRPAYIASGARIPLQQVERYYADGIIRERRGTQLQDVTGGFYVVPRLQGDTVTLEILQHDDRLARGGTLRTQSTGTVVRGGLGEWLNLGAVDTRSDSSAGGLGRRLDVQGGETQQISVRVDCLDCAAQGQGRR